MPEAPSDYTPHNLAETQDALLNELKQLAERMKQVGMYWTAMRVMEVHDQSGAGSR